MYTVAVSFPLSARRSAMSPLVMIGAVLALLAGADEPAPGSKGAPLERLQGRWTMESVVINGEAVPEDLVKTGTLKIEGNRYDPKLGENAFGATFEIDAAKQPAAIDFTYTAGPQEGKTIKGIFKLDGDT